MAARPAGRSVWVLLLFNLLPDDPAPLTLGQHSDVVP